MSQSNDPASVPTFYTDMRLPETVDKMAPVDDCITRLDMVSSRIDESVRALSLRINPILQQTPESDEKRDKRPDYPGNSTVTRRLTELAANLEESLARLQDLHTRIEV